MLAVVVVVDGGNTSCPPCKGKITKSSDKKQTTKGNLETRELFL